MKDEFLKYLMVIGVILVVLMDIKINGYSRTSTLVSIIIGRFGILLFIFGYFVSVNKIVYGKFDFNIDKRTVNNSKYSLILIIAILSMWLYSPMINE